MEQKAHTHQTDFAVDYLVIGAGISGLNFVDELLTQTNATFLLVDRRDLPGGHWTETYSHVKLHQPANQYGVSSKELSTLQKDEHGLNKGFLNLASAPEIQSYCYTLVRDHFLPSGRVTFLASTEYLPDGTLRRLPSGKILHVKIRKKLVDASYLANNTSLHHQPSFTVKGVTCIPPHHLAKYANHVSQYAVLGAGKTAMDACLWLLEQEVDPARIRFIVPGDYWIFNRALFQLTPEYFENSVKAFTAMFDSIKIAGSAQDVFLGFEKAGLVMRLSSTINPVNFHAATMAPLEVEALRNMPNIIRKGHVTKLEPHQITFTKGTIEATPDTLYIDCTASSLPDKPAVPVFQPGKIVLQIIRQPLVPISCAKIAFLESLDISDEEKNYHSTPIPFQRTIEDYVINMGIDMLTRAREEQDPALKQWLGQTRLSPLSRDAASIKSDEKEKIELMTRLGIGFGEALAHMPKLIEAIKNGA